LLRMTSLPVTEIAFLFHYHSSQGFSRSFKKYTGLTPSEYRTSAVWDFNKLQPSLLLENYSIPDVKLCELDERLTYTDLITEHDHIFDPAAKDVTKTIRNWVKAGKILQKFLLHIIQMKHPITARVRVHFLANMQ